MKYIENGTCGQVSVYTKHIRLSTCASYPLCCCCCCWSLTFFINSRDYRHTTQDIFLVSFFNLKGDLALLFYFTKELLCRPLFYSHSSCQKIIPPPTKHTETFFSRLLLYNKKKKKRKYSAPRWKRMGEDAPPLVFRWRREISGKRKPTWGDCDETPKVQKREI